MLERASSTLGVAEFDRKTAFKNNSSKKKGNQLVTEILAPPPESSISQFFFPGLPDHYPLRKKVQITKNNSTAGMLWDLSQILFALLSCLQYVAETYSTSYKSAVYFRYLELILTQFFACDFLLNWYISSSWRYFLDPMTMVDMLTICPVYVQLLLGADNTNFAVLRFVRILRLIRIFRTFKALKTLNGIRRQILSLTLTLLCMTFLAAGNNLF